MSPGLVIGLTGSIACGKSTVLGMFADLGAATIDADTVYHELIAPHSTLWAAIRDRFGPGVVAADGSIDRSALGKIVFKDHSALADLDALTHPAVAAEVRRRLDALAAPVAVIDAVKLVESGLADDCDQLWVVICPTEVQIDRLMQRNRISRSDAERRVASQPPLADKIARATTVITARWRALCDVDPVSIERG